MQQGWEGGEGGGQGDGGESLDAGSGEGDVEGLLRAGDLTVLTAQPALGLAVGQAEEVSPVGGGGGGGGGDDDLGPLAGA